jgi:putative restriction endonuclease
MIERFIEWYSNIKQARSSGGYAPHKPLTIAFALVKVIKGQRWIDFNEDRKDLEKLIGENTKFNSKPNCLQPMGRLLNDSKINHFWVSVPKQLILNKSGDIPISVAKEASLKVGFSDDLYEWLSADTKRAQYLLSEVIKDNFPESLHSGILESIGAFDLPLEPIPLELIETKVSRIKRDPKFPPRILALYDNRCAFCGLKISFLNNENLSMEAAHIKWKKYGGECTPHNGLSLCPTHHYTFDRGIWSANKNFEIQLSENVLISRKEDVFFEPFLGESLMRYLRDQDHAPSLENLAWHHNNILK